MKLSLLIALLSISFFSLNAQETALKKYQENSIYLQQGFGGYKYVKEGQLYNVGFMESKLKRELEISPNAIVEFKKHRRNQWISISLGIASGVLLVSSISEQDFQLTPYWLGLGGAVLSGVFATQSRNKLQKSIWLYNQDILR